MRAANATVWESPDILPRDAWVRRKWNEQAALDPSATPVLLSRIQEDTLWRLAIGDANELLDVAATASAAARTWDLLHAWKLPFDQHKFAESAETEAFLAWSRFVQAALREKAWITAAELPAALIERNALRSNAPIEYAGFHEMTPRDRDLFTACGASSESGAGQAGARTDRPSLYCAALQDQEAELTRAAHWARTKLANRIAGTIGIVIPGLAQLRAAAERIFDDVLNPGLDFAPPEAPGVFHISAGARASEHPLIATALLVLGLEIGLSLAEAGALLRSPFLKLDAAGGAKLDAHCAGGAWQPCARTICGNICRSGPGTRRRICWHRRAGQGSGAPSSPSW